jgi:hypothetical protein
MYAKFLNSDSAKLMNLYQYAENRAGQKYKARILFPEVAYPVMFHSRTRGGDSGLRRVSERPMVEGGSAAPWGGGGGKTTAEDN